MSSLLQKMNFVSALILGMALISTPAWANSRFNNGDYYEVVIEDAGPDTAEPGIYKINSKTGEVELVLKGNVVGVNRAAKGIRAFNQISKSTGAMDALAILDGHLTLFNHNTREKNPKSFVRFGADKNIPVVDILSGRPIQLPAVSANDEINIFEGPVYRSNYPNGGQLYIVSVKTKTMIGDGVTFAFLSGGSETNDKVSVLGNKAFVLAYEFYDQSQLGRMTMPSKAWVDHPFVFAPLLIESVESQVQKLSSETSISYRLSAHLKRYLNYIETGKNPNLNPKDPVTTTGIPIFDLNFARAFYNEMPVEVIAAPNGSNVAGQAFDFHSQSFTSLDLQVDLMNSRRVVSLRAVPAANGQSLYFIDRDDAKLISFFDNSIFRDKNGNYLIYGESQLDFQKREETRKHLNYLIFFDSTGGLKLAYRAIKADNTLRVMDLGRSIKPGDKISFVVKETGAYPGYKAILLNVQKPKSKKGTILRYIIEDTQSPRLVDTKILYEGTPMTTLEMAYRAVDTGKDLLFDNVTPVEGFTVYNKANPKEAAKVTEIMVDGRITKHVPYQRIFQGIAPQGRPNGDVPQVYIRPLTQRILASELSYRYYEPKGAHFQASGFYLEGKRDKTTPLAFLPGRPLYSGKDQKADKIVHVSDSADLSFKLTESGPGSAVAASLFPFTESMKIEKGKEADVRTFLMGLGLTSWNMDGSIASVEVKYPYKSMTFTKILPGQKGNNNQFHVLMAFRKDAKIEGSQDILLAFTAYFATEKAPDGSDRLKLTTNQPAVLHKGVLNPNDLINHLRVDAEGAFYWLVDPSINFESSKYQVRKLTNPTENLGPRNSKIMSLREPENIKSSNIGSGGRKFTGGGLWELHGEYHLKDRMIGANAYLDALNSSKKKNGKDDKKKGDEEKETKENGKEARPAQVDPMEKMLFEGFESYLDGWAQEKSGFQPKVEVLLVEPALKEKFRQRVMNRLVSDRQTKFSLKNPKFHFYYADSSLDDIEVGEEFMSLAALPGNDGKMLYVDPEMLLNHNIKTRNYESGKTEKVEVDPFLEGTWAASREKVEESEPVFKHDDLTADANLAVIMATGGKAKSLKGYRRVKSQAETVPSLMIATPEEWRAIQLKNDAENSEGVLDRFNLNFDYLTSSWTMWPPNTEKAADEVKELARVPYNTEEMKVFPSLDRMIHEAASGALKGRQKIIIVPNELLPIVNKLIMLRWSTQDLQASLPWSFANRGMAFFHLNTKEATQSLIHDNFRAIRGASSTRHSVLLGELESVIRIGRPTNPTGRNFTLRDPVKSTESFVMEREDALQPSADGTRPQYSMTMEERVEFEELKGEVAELDVEIEADQGRLKELREDKSRYSSEDFAQEEKGLMESIGDAERQKNLNLARMNQLEEGPDTSSSSANDQKHYPHVMWTIAAEGRQIQPKRLKSWNLKDATDRQAATILVGTEDQLAQIETDMAFENKFFNLREHFEVEHLQSPDIQTKVHLVEQLLNRPEVAALGIQFELDDAANGRDPRSQLVYQFVNRIDQIAYDLKIEKTTAFVKAFVALRQSLSEDLDLRRNRRIDDKYIGRLFSRVFPMSLNPDILDPSDYLRQISKMDQATRSLEKAGYTGSRDLKRRFFETILSQTRHADTSRPIPNSQILFGGTSTGKTYLLKTFFKMADLVEYMPNRPNNENADYILIQVGDLTAEKTDDPSKMSIDKMIENVMDLLSQPKGARAHIVIDDFHKAVNGDVRQKLFRFVMGFFEARNGMLMVRSKDGRRVREIPVQNLNIYMTLNPTSHSKTRREYVEAMERYSPAELLKREVLAAMSDGNFKPEESELARWSDILNLDHFPRSAKVPELGKRVREYARSSPSMALVDPLVIDALVEKFSNANARELLAPAAAALTAIPHSARPSKLYTVTLKERVPGLNQDPEPNVAQVNATELQNATRRLTQVDPVNVEEPKSILKFISFVMQNFRLQVFNNMAIEAHMSDTLRLDRPGMASFLKSNFLIGTSTHILQNTILPVGELVIRHDQLGFFNRNQQEEFYQHYREAGAGKYFPPGFSSRDLSSRLDLDKFMEGTWGTMSDEKSRKDVIIDYTERVREVLSRALVIYTRLHETDDLQKLPFYKEADIRRWFDDLKEKDTDEEFRAVMQELITVFMDFTDDFSALDLKDVRTLSSTDVTVYDQVRFFDLIVDKAITQLPWGNVAKFTYDVVDLSSDYSLGARTSYKEYVGVHTISPFAITTPEFMNEMLEVGMSSRPGADKNRRGQRLEEMKTGFQTACEILLKGN